MMRPRIVTAAACVFAMALSACSSDTEGRTNLLGTFAKQSVATVQGKNKKPKGKLPYAVVTKEQLENTKVAALQINLETRGGSDVLRRATQRNDAAPGTVSVWTGSQGAQVITRNGVLVGTRGIGGDIISTDANAMVRALRSQRTSGGERRYFISNGSYSDVEVVLSCDIENLGRATTQVVHLTYQTVHLRETCIGGAGDKTRIVNEYWVQPSSGLIRRSRQWAGPYSGYYELILLRK